MPHPCFSGARKRRELLRNRLTLAFWGAPKRPEWLRNPCIFGKPRQKGRKSVVGASPVPSQGPRRGRNCYVTPALLWVRNAKRRGKIRSGCLTPMFLEAQKRPVLLRNPCILGGPKRQGRGENQKRIYHPCLVGGPEEGPIVRNPRDLGGGGGGNAKCGGESKSGHITPAFSGNQKGAQMATSPVYSLGSAMPSTGRKSEVAASPLPSQGPKRGRNCYATPALSEVPNANRRGKIRNGYLTLIQLGAQKRAELLSNPCIIGGPERQPRG